MMACRLVRHGLVLLKTIRGRTRANSTDKTRPLARSVATYPSFKAQRLVITSAATDHFPSLASAPLPGSFGDSYATSMLEINWTEAGGWGPPIIQPLSYLHLHPASSCLHYANQLFAGVRVYRGKEDGRLRIFRIDQHIERFSAGTIRAALPRFDKDELVSLLCRLVARDVHSVPDIPGAELYVLIVLIATGNTLEIRRASGAKLFAISLPQVDDLSRNDPINLFIDPRFIRSCPGSVGSINMGGTQAGLITVQEEAMTHGCANMLWVYGEKETITDASGMNVFFVSKTPDGRQELVTPSLTNNTILPGVMRDTVIQIAQEAGIHIREETLTMTQLRESVVKGTLVGAFGTSTMAGVVPFKGFKYRDHKNEGKVENIALPVDLSVESVTGRIIHDLYLYQHGTVDRPEWITII